MATMESLGLAAMLSPKENSPAMTMLHPCLFFGLGEGESRQRVPIWLELFSKPINPEKLEALATGPETQHSKFQTLESWCNLPKVTLVENGSQLIVPLATFWSWATLTKKHPAVAAFTPVIFTHEYTNHVLAGLGWE